MWQKRNEKRSKHMTKPAKEKLFKSPIKPVETTVISASSKLEGRIEAEGNLIIDGSVKGTIKCGSLEIMEDGNVDASVEAEAVNVAEGDISYRTLSIEAGGLLDGNVSKFK
jgi:cytoskeletal protein CcmA (bactofilin family)